MTKKEEVARKKDMELVDSIMKLLLEQTKKQKAKKNVVEQIQVAREDKIIEK